MLKPDQLYVSVLDINPSELVEAGYRAVLLDLDNTLQPRNAMHIPAGVARWVDSLKEAGLGVAIVTNTNNDRVMRAARDLNVLVIRNAFKPFKGGYVQACACLGVSCRDAIMVGDQCYTDILGAHRCGMDAIMVLPQSSSDPLQTYILRLVDALAVRGMRARGRVS